MGPKLTREGGKEGEAPHGPGGRQSGRERGREGGRRGFVFLHCCRRAAVASLIRPSLSLPRRDDVGDCGQLANEQRLARARQRRRRPRLRVDA